MEEAIKRLEELNIEYELIKHEAVHTIEDMNNLEEGIFKGAEICKNLFLRDQKGKRHFLVMLCSEKQADLQSIQEQAYTTRLSFASPERLKKYLGLEAGYVSVMGLINDENKDVEILIDEDLKKKDVLVIHPNTNEASLLIKYDDVIKFIKEQGNEMRFIKI